MRSTEFRFHCAPGTRQFYSLFLRVSFRPSFFIIKVHFGYKFVQQRVKTENDCHSYTYINCLENPTQYQYALRSSWCYFIAWIRKQ